MNPYGSTFSVVPHPDAFHRRIGLHNVARWGGWIKCQGTKDEIEESHWSLVFVGLFILMSDGFYRYQGRSYQMIIFHLNLSLFVYIFDICNEATEAPRDFWVASFFTSEKANSCGKSKVFMVQPTLNTLCLIHTYFAHRVHTNMTSMYMIWVLVQCLVVTLPPRAWFSHSC